MYELQIHVKNIRNEKLDEYQWGKYWNNFKKWECPQGNWSEESVYLTNAKIRSYGNAPLLPLFGSLKEEASKFIVSRYQRGKF